MTTGTTQEAAISPGRAACEAFWAAVGSGPEIQRPGAAWGWALSQGTELAWEAAAKAAAGTAERERDEARANLATADALIKQFERITTAWTRGMYSAWIDCQRRDFKAAIECLSEGMDGYDGTEWNGTETGAEWWERTKAEEEL